MVRLMIIAFVAVASLWGKGAPAMSIGVFADSLGTDCRLVIPFPGDPVTLFVVAKLEGLEGDGVVDASFRITGFPDDWTREVIATPGGILIGEVFGAGAYVVYSNCIVNTPLVLMKLRLSPTSSVQQGLTVSVTANREDAGLCFLNPCGPCAKFCGCDGLPACYCAAAIVSRINSSCSVAVGEDTWSVLTLIIHEVEDEKASTC